MGRLRLRAILRCIFIRRSAYDLHIHTSPHRPAPCALHEYAPACIIMHDRCINIQYGPLRDSRRLGTTLASICKISAVCACRLTSCRPRAHYEFSAERMILPGVGATNAYIDGLQIPVGSVTATRTGDGIFRRMERRLEGGRLRAICGVVT